MPDDQRPLTQATFRIRQNGQPTEAWFPDWMEATDATGNEGSFQIIDSGITNGLAFYDAQATSLSPSEVWRLRMRFTHVKELPATQLWTSPPLSVQETGSNPITITSNFQAYTVRMEYDHGTIDLKLNPAPTNAQLRLVDIVDNKGSSVERLGGSADEDCFLSRLSIPPETKSITVTISLCESVEFEFLAQPVAR
jgi:hypothetical protein